MIIYETSTGGTGCLDSLTHASVFSRMLDKVNEILHGVDEEEGCESACYECLLSFYNQRDHLLLDRHPVLRWLQSIEDLEITPTRPDDEEHFNQLLGLCQSHLEEKVLRAIQTANIHLPDEAQKTIYGSEYEPLAIADSFYEPRIIVFVDGSPHYLDYVSVGDEEKRLKLRPLGYRIVVIPGDDVERGIAELASRIN